jgi:hypothetical protein
MLLKILKPSDKAKAVDYITRLADTKQYTVEVKVKREKRSVSQNRLYFLWLTCLMEETGSSKEDLHEFFKQHVLESEEKYLFNDKYSVTICRSTTSLDTKEMHYYLERIRQFAHVELGIGLPNPDDLGWEDFYIRYKNFI